MEEVCAIFASPDFFDPIRSFAVRGYWKFVEKCIHRRNNNNIIFCPLTYKRTRKRVNKCNSARIRKHIELFVVHGDLFDNTTRREHNINKYLSIHVVKWREQRT